MTNYVDTQARNVQWGGASAGRGLDLAEKTVDQFPLVVTSASLDLAAATADQHTGPAFPFKVELVDLYLVVDDAVNTDTVVSFGIVGDADELGTFTVTAAMSTGVQKISLSAFTEVYLEAGEIFAVESDGAADVATGWVYAIFVPAD